jgi:hypothetical protein
LIWQYAAHLEVSMEAAVNDDKAKIWRDRIESQRGSGLSVRAWCLANDAREHSFFWWRARLGLSPAQRPARRSAKPIAFARVVVEPSTTAATPAVTEALRLRVAGGRELVFPASMPAERVAKLVHAIEGRPSIIEAAP